MPEPGSEHRSDAELLGIIQSGHADHAERERAFEALYFRHRDFVVRVSRRFAGDDESAMDAAQEVFAYLLRKLPRLKLSGKLSTYLYPIAKSCGLDKRRKAAGERRKLEGRLAAGVQDGEDEDGGTPSLMDDRAVARALDHLPDAQREVLLMRVVDGMSVDEVAAALEIPPGTVKSRLHHAIGAMRERLAGLG